MGTCPNSEDQSPEDPYFNYGAVDGGCYSMKTGLQGELRGWEECAVADPWILPCEESDVPGTRLNRLEQRGAAVAGHVGDGHGHGKTRTNVRGARFLRTHRVAPSR